MKKIKNKGIIILLCLVVFLGVLLWDSNSRIVVSEYSAGGENLPESFAGYRIVQLSDIHGKSFHGKLARRVEELEPDIIVITGDLCDRDTDMAEMDKLLLELSAIAPIYYVSGNHEWGEGRIEETKALLQKHGCVYLSNEYILLEQGGERIVLCGVEDPNSYSEMPRPNEVVAAMRSEYPDSFAILLGHRNYWAERYSRLEIDIIFCGHAHGGIVRLPWLGGVLGTGFEFFPDYVGGMNSVGDYELIISRGLGNSAGIPRFLNNPEIVLLTLE